MSNIVQEGLKRLAIAACLPALTNAKTITNTRTHTYTMTTDMVVKTKEAWKTLLRAALTKHCVRHCFIPITALKIKDYTPFHETAGDIFWRDSPAKAENWSPLRTKLNFVSAQGLLLLPMQLGELIAFVSIVRKYCLFTVVTGSIQFIEGACMCSVHENGRVSRGTDCALN